MKKLPDGKAGQVWLWLVILVFVSPVTFGSVLEVGTQQAYQPLATYLEIYRTDNPAVGVEDVSGALADEFSRVDVEQLNLAYTPEIIWLKMTLKNRESHPVKLFLESGFSRLDYIILYEPAGQNQWLESTGGDRIPWYQWPLQSRLLTFPVSLDPQEEKTWYIKVHSTSTMHIPLGIVSDEVLIENAEQRFFSDGLFYGLCLAVIFVALMTALVMREDIYFFYLMHVIAGTLTVMALDGAGFQLWPDALDFQEYSVVFFECLNGVFLILFARRYLRLRTYLPRVDIINRIFIGYMLAMIFVAPLFPYYVSSFLAVVPISLMVLGMFMQGLYRALQGDKPAIVFTTAWSLCFSICIFVTVSNLGLVHNYVNSVYSLKLAFVSEYVVLLGGLGYRLFLLRRGEELSNIQALTERAENHAKGEILARISHEIRTPLNGILGITDLLQRTTLDKQQQRYVATVSDAGQSLLTIIGDVLDHARIRSGQISLEHIPFSLTDLLDRVSDMFQVEAERQGLRFVVEVDAELPDEVVGDPTRFRQIVVNLLGNACKFTEKGEIALRVRRDWSDDGKVRLRVEVEDTGIGISPALRPVLFNSFTQGAPDTTRRYGGSGLGLTISRQLVELMEGVIDFDSQPGKGSRFWFQLTLDISQEDEYSNKICDSSFDIEDFRFFGNKVLVAEDNDTNWLVISSYLSELGVVPTRASDGNQAVQLYQKERFDLVFLDCAMPGMSGFEVVSAIRSLEAMDDRELTPVIAVTAHVSSAIRNRCLMAGMDDYLSKPFTREEIAVVLKRYMFLSARVQSHEVV